MSNCSAGMQLPPGRTTKSSPRPAQLRPAWRCFVEAAGGLPAPEFGRRWEQAQRLLRQNSLAYPDLRDPRPSAIPGSSTAFRW